MAVNLGFKEILELIDKVAQSGISSVEVETAGATVRIEGTRRQEPAPQAVEQGSHPASTYDMSSTPPAPAQQVGGAPAPPAGEPELDSSWHIVTSPIVGTFYMSPNPDADPFVQMGDRVTRGKVLCIIEAMKLMNEIESDADGTIVKIFPQNGQPIEYGEKLFAIKS